MKSKRFEVLAARPVNQDGYVQEWPEVGLIAMNSPFDPKPSIKIENGVITEMDGKCRADFDMLDTFIADHAIRPGNAEKAMAMVPWRSPARSWTSTSPVRRSWTSPCP